MDVGEAGQGDRDHLRRRVQLHRAGTERDHAAVQRDVLVLEPLEVAQHLVLGVVLVEHRLLEERRVARQLRRDATAARAAPARRRSTRGEPRPVPRASPSRRARCRRACRSIAPQVEALRQRRPHQRIGASRSRSRSCRRTRRAAGDGRRAAPHRPAAAPAGSPAAAMRFSPSGPCHTAYMPAITASSTCAVQMFEVAFSRRMCCSRVCSASRIAGWPAASMRDADQPARHVPLVGIASSP